VQRTADRRAVPQLSHRRVHTALKYANIREDYYDNDRAFTLAATSDLTEVISGHSLVIRWSVSGQSLFIYWSLIHRSVTGKSIVICLSFTAYSLVIH